MVSSRLPSDGSPPAATHHAEPVGQRGASCAASGTGAAPPARSPRPGAAPRTTARQRGEVVPLAVHVVRQDAQLDGASTALTAGGPGRRRRRRRRCCPARPARPRRPAAGRAAASDSTYDRAGRAQQQLAGLDHAAADDQHLRVEDLHQVGQADARASGRSGRTPSADDRVAGLRAAAVTIGPVIAVRVAAGQLQQQRRRGSGSCRAPARAKRTSALPLAYCSMQPSRPQPQRWPPGTSAHVAELGGDAVRAADQLAAEHDAAADAGADGEHAPSSRRRRGPRRTGTRPRRRRWRRSRRRPAGRRRRWT